MLYEELIGCLKELTKEIEETVEAPWLVLESKVPNSRPGRRDLHCEEATSEGISSTTAAETKEFIKQLWKRPCFIELAWGQRRLWYSDLECPLDTSRTFRASSRA
jgi:hypothetical protein